ncbi:MAG TPA: GGDEF domain-containing protein [Geminicoccaceae bacterium]|nr:GGDEF domain-containing protein [Geminicoccaceae bacterium]
MPKHSLQPYLDPPSGERLGELIGGVAQTLTGGNGQLHPGTAEVTPHQARIAVPARPEELQRLLGASIDVSRQLTAQVRRLESELQRRSTELAKLRGELRGAVEDALTDPLTGLANRRSFDLELKAIAARAGGSSPAHLVMADIDHFKRVNDVHGHDTGDQVLRIVSEVLLAHVRRDNLVARVGGDEFALLLQGASPRYAARIAIRLRRLLASRQLVVRGHPEITERITLSIGVARWRAGDSSAQWYARADVALYEAKRRGRNRIHIARNKVEPRRPT